MQQLILILATSSYDLSSCLVNCSNNGICLFDTYTQKYLCRCLTNFVGPSCQTDTRACSSYPCLNNATCLNYPVNGSSSTFKCVCDTNYFGTYCENKVDLCENRKCSNKGYCFINSTDSPYCKCFIGYSGNQCDIELTSAKIVYRAQISSILICVVCIALTVLTVVLNDACNIWINNKENKKHPQNRHRVIHFKYRNSMNDKLFSQFDIKL